MATIRPKYRLEIRETPKFVAQNLFVNHEENTRANLQCQRTIVSGNFYIDNCYEEETRLQRNLFVTDFPDYFLVVTNKKRELRNFANHC